MKRLAALLSPSMLGRLLAPLALAASAAAQGPTSNTWTNVGLYGGGLRAIATSPTSGDVVLAGLENGSLLPARSALYRSTDSGQTWSAVPDLAGTAVLDLEFASDDIAFAASNLGLWKSTDRGVNWTLLPAVTSFPPDYVTDLLVHPSVPGLLWMGTAFSTSVVWRSTDYGVTWTPLGPGAGTFGQAVSVAVDPLNAARIGVVIFEGIAFGCRVFLSTNGGTTWTERSAGLPDPSVGAVDLEHDGQRWLVAGGSLPRVGEEVYGLFESHDDGVTWSELSDPSWPSRVLADVELDPTDPDNLYVASSRGIFRSTDGGATWLLPTPGTGQLLVTQLASLHGPTPVFAALSVLGVLKSVNGTNFFPSATGITELMPTGVAVNGRDPNEVAVSIHNHPGGAVLSSVDRGLTWTREPLEPAGWRQVGFDGDGRLHAVSNGFLDVADDGLYRRQADGTWTRVGPDQPTSTAQYDSLAFGAAGSGLLLIGGTENVSQPRLWRSLDDGATWSKTTVFPFGTSVADILVLPGNPNPALIVALRIVNSGGPGSGVFRSATLGETWAATSGLGQFGHFTSLARTPFARNRVYVVRDGLGTSGSLFVSDDRGRNWTSLQGGGFGRVVTDQLRSERLYLAPATFTLGSAFPPLRITNDGGTTLEDFDQGLPAGVGRTRALALSPGPCARLFYAAEAGVYMRDEVSCQLEQSDDSFSMSGDSLDFDLAAGAGASGDGYQVLGSLSGSAPGVPLFGVSVPLNLDDYLITTLTMPNLPNFAGFLGTLDAEGRGAATISVTPPGYPSLVGSRFTHAFVTFAFGPLRVLLASNPVSFDAFP